MDTPIYDFVKEYLEKGTVRLHMPGHKGSPLLGCEALDITEIKGADDLYHAQGIIRQSENNATRLFGTKRTFYATGGSSQCIGAMVYLAMLRGKKGQPILAARNAHKAFLHTCALLDLEVVWIYPEEEASLCSCPILTQQLESILKSMEVLPFALYITSPDYLGGMADIKGLSEVCRKYGIPLLVDNAHGAYLRFLPESLHPMDLGADMCCDSAHKTLPVLTGGAYLHIGRDALPFEKDGKNALALFGSTSPSYLTLQSLDLCNEVLAEGYREKMHGVCEKVKQLAVQLREKGYFLQNYEPLKIVLEGAKMGITGYDLAKFLRESGIEPEFADADHLVMMFSTENGEVDFKRIENALPPMIAKSTEGERTTLPFRGEQVMSIREAMFARRCTVKVEQALGRICATPAVSCPPAIPIAISGERITEEMIRLFFLYGIEEIDVVVEL
ncbi:amino acid decarboxylase [Anaerotignum propionicum]|uniref:Arginine decarboxylase n=1 Tax=Anaerotignum propionicum DSM 1682 TaxID=991789 RepID=A0A110A7R1_ANAPI|nr:amino acid decarboxylase [Anaerotignum propionicum]AMJ42488.1 arginine decarboxylase [Anaerotignum propionicum DSM 1682]SHE33323.1 Arginine/lysine/ornithine decarboxylase [[Clostridium] propionicum DSM 1682] [Anaerotignum propionicum DSM 1682]